MSLHNKLIPFLVASTCVIALGTWGFVTRDATSINITQPAIAPSSAPTSSAIAVAIAIPVLPVVHVRANAPVPVLPRVVVRADDAERAAAMRPGVTAKPLIASGSDATRTGDIEVPRARLGMPYYSFGKVLPRISKE